MVRTTLGGIPAILRIPKSVARPPIALWHGFGPPASEQALMDLLPLDTVPAVKVYLGLPLFGARAPAVGSPSVAERQMKDYGSLLFEPAVMGAANELPAVIAALREMHCLGRDEPIGLFGFSAGGAAVLFALAERKVPVRAAVVVGAPSGLSGSIKAFERATKRPYAWTAHSRQLAARSDAVARAAEIATGPMPPALLLLHGANDAVIPPDGTRELYEALLPFYRRENSADSLKLQTVPGVTHNWTDANAAEALRKAVSDWFK